MRVFYRCMYINFHSILPIFVEMFNNFINFQLSYHEKIIVFIFTGIVLEL